ncbi:hypothetical protein NBT05_02605 [Aquimarina sp. ERC-38]|uniref:hypothetical protein n=1 Tax=Aquimarina sp. ERC-38 TaxID=2949996 RepID=UPI002246AE93|nr:hypothetical protein [Aquimarina sp. ERC-38]UZO81373.1 hypothetical protein NBT05_02605 [Aquimarina sp. ERC-38]
MIKTVKHTGSRDKVVRREFIPITFTVEREGQFINAEAKLPFATSRVNALLVTSRVEHDCKEGAPPPRYFYGYSDKVITDASFRKLSNGALFDPPYPPDTVFKGFGRRWYFACPKTESFPVLVENGYYRDLVNPLELPLMFEGYCGPQPYYLWTGELPGEGIGEALFSFNPPS